VESYFRSKQRNREDVSCHVLGGYVMLHKMFLNVACILHELLMPQLVAHLLSSSCLGELASLYTSAC
jgi:hypothetical protein